MDQLSVASEAVNDRLLICFQKKKTLLTFLLMFWLFPSVVFVKRETSDGRWVRAGWRPYLLTYFLTLLLNVFYRVSLGFIWSYWVLLGFTGLY